MARTSPLWLVVPVLLSLAPGCAGRTRPLNGDGGVVTPAEDGAVDAVDAVVPGARNAIVRNDCGPTDGPALTFAIATSPTETIGCSTTIMPASGVDVITLTRDLPTGPTSITFLGGDGRGYAAHCRSGSCTDAASATITLTEFTSAGTTARGTYSLRLVDGTDVSGSFFATMCHNPSMCG